MLPVLLLLLAQVQIWEDFVSLSVCILANFELLFLHFWCFLILQMRVWDRTRQKSLSTYVFTPTRGAWSAAKKEGRKKDRVKDGMITRKLKQFQQLKRCIHETCVGGGEWDPFFFLQGEGWWRVQAWVTTDELRPQADNWSSWWRTPTSVSNVRTWTTWTLLPVTLRDWL